MDASWRGSKDERRVGGFIAGTFIARTIVGVILLFPGADVGPKQRCRLSGCSAWSKRAGDGQKIALATKARSELGARFTIVGVRAEGERGHSPHALHTNLWREYFGSSVSTSL